MTAARGVYALLLALASSQTITVGRLGGFHFPAGYYLYLGSAQGPGGLAARLALHCRREKKLHWHIDYLRPAARLEQIWVLVTDERVECQWAAAAQALPGVSLPASRFGASDCRCPAHLFHYPARPESSVFANAAGIPVSRLKVFGCDGTRTPDFTDGN